MDTLSEFETDNGNLYPEDEMYFRNDDDYAAILAVEYWPNVPKTEFSKGKSSMQMQERFERELRQNLPDEISIERKTSLQ